MVCLPRGGARSGELGARASFALFALRKKNKGALVEHSAVRNKPTRLDRLGSQNFFSRTLATIQKGTAGSQNNASVRRNKIQVLMKA